MSQTTGILVGLTGANKRDVELIDNITGKRLMDNKERKAAHLKAEARAKAEAKRAETEAKARLKAENQQHQTVLNMVQNGLSTDLISKLTGFSISEIESISLKNEN